MTATVAVIDYNAATSTVTATNLNLGSTNAGNLSPSTYPIAAGNNSYEKWFKIKFGGTFTQVDTIKFHKSAGDLVAGEVLNYTGETETFATPTTAVSGEADTAVPVSTPTNANVGISGTTSGSCAPGESTDFIVLQASISSQASAGAVNQKTFTITYDET